ncbi:MAG: IPT/TIG domain-containing protein, partial [Ignavibacteria bacterium]|nr:IPT/TIG domain-containing protein [Ignavibacteria bacterium]
MKKFYLTLTAIFFAVMLIACNKSETGSNAVSDDSSLDNPKGGNILAVPSISSISPTSAEIGDQITISGTNFGRSQGSRSYVTVNGIRATVYLSWSQTSITVLVPSGTTEGPGKVSVYVINKRSNEADVVILKSSVLWEACNNGLGEAKNQTLLVNGNDVFFGGTGGIFLSTDNGVSWTAKNTGLT